MRWDCWAQYNNLELHIIRAYAKKHVVEKEEIDGHLGKVKSRRLVLKNILKLSL